MDLKTLFGVKEGEVISIVGAGGKTSLMFSLAEELRCCNKVLVTTTTKIYAPESSKYDYIVMENVDKLTNVYESKSKGIYVIGNTINKYNKIESISKKSLEQSLEHFDYILIEADGSKTKPIKGWNETEPVINDNTTITIGVLNIQVLGKEIIEENVHRIDKFLELTEGKLNETIEISHLKKVILNPNGLFKNSIGKKVLFINQVDCQEHLFKAQELVQNILKENKDYIDKIIIGSLKKKNVILTFQKEGLRCLRNL